VKAAVRLFALIGCTALGFAADSAREIQEGDIREAAFRYQFNEHRGAKVFFIGIGEKTTDPSDEFMKRFADNKPPVRKVSTCQFNAQEATVTDKKTGERGAQFWITSLKRISDSEVKVDGGNFYSGLGASGNIYTLKKENGKWRVVKDEIKWIK
jgi:hypothetical protein